LVQVTKWIQVIVNVNCQSIRYSYHMLVKTDHEGNIYLVTVREIHWQDCQNIQYSIDSKRFLRKPISNFELLDCAAAMIKHPREMIDLCVN
jgi:hypothetical protein